MANIARQAAERHRPALRLVSTREMDRAQWLDVRRRGIGSSDAAAAVGLNPYKSQLELWLEKTGKGQKLASPDPAEEEGPTYWGTLLEPIVAAHYTQRTGRRVRRINAVLQHPSQPWMLANIDREILGSDDVQILECKTAGLNGARLWGEGVPEYVQLQVLHQLAVTGKQAADVAVLICGQELRIHRIERDEPMIAQLIALEASFWKLVTENVPPPADGSDSAERALRSLYPRDLGATVDLRSEPRLEASFQELLAVRATLQELNDRASQLKQAIQQRMGEATKAVFSTGVATWKRCADSTRLDSGRLARERPDIVTAYRTVEDGVRRFVINQQPQS